MPETSRGLLGLQGEKGRKTSKKEKLALDRRSNFAKPSGFLKSHTIRDSSRWQLHCHSHVGGAPMRPGVVQDHSPILRRRRRHTGRR